MECRMSNGYIMKIHKNEKRRDLFISSFLMAVKEWKTSEKMKNWSRKRIPIDCWLAAVRCSCLFWRLYVRAVYCSRAPLKNWGHKTRKKREKNTRRRTTRTTTSSAATRRLWNFEWNEFLLVVCVSESRTGHLPLLNRTDSYVTYQEKWNETNDTYIWQCKASSKWINDEEDGKKWKKITKTFTKWSNHHLPDTCGTCHPPAACIIVNQTTPTHPLLSDSISGAIVDSWTTFPFEYRK